MGRNWKGKGSGKVKDRKENKRQFTWKEKNNGSDGKAIQFPISFQFKFAWE